MHWNEVRRTYMDQLLIIEALQAHSQEEHRILDEIAVVDACADGAMALHNYCKLHQTYPEREFYYVHTSRAHLDIRERQWLGIRMGHLPVAPR